uniref:Uncharacterized protein n=1 Tax=Eptatretus burgeri TaxID=7764 RepID=A0A8C4PZF5_EPTBU
MVPHVFIAAAGVRLGQEILKWSVQCGRRFLFGPASHADTPEMVTGVESLIRDGFGAHPAFKCIVAEVPPESKSAEGEQKGHINVFFTKLHHFIFFIDIESRFLEEKVGGSQKKISQLK